MRFIVLSDSKGKEKGINEEVLTKLLRESKKLTPVPHFIVLGGDNVAGSSHKEIVVNQLKRLRKLIENYYPNTPLIPVVGNHEVNNEPIDSSYEKIFEEIYSDMLPNPCLESFNRTAYYVDYGDTRLISLNSFHYGELNIIGEKQLAWLQRTASAPVKNKFVFVHSPAFPTGAHYGHCLDIDPASRDSFWRIVETCNIDIVFSGHEHNYSRRKIGSVRPTYQIITGGAGEKLRDKYKDKKGIIVPPIAKYHFVVVDVEETNIKISAISSEGRLLDEFKIDKP